MFKVLTDFLDRLKDTPIAMVVAVAVIGAVFLTGVEAFLTSVITLSPQAPYITLQTQVAKMSELLSVGVLLGTFFVLLLLLFIFRDPSDSYSRDQSDSYSNERKQLVGKWEMTLVTWLKDGSWKRTEISYPVHFSIDQKTKKLIVEFDQQDSKIFKPLKFIALAAGLTETKLIFIANPSQQLKDGFDPPCGFERTLVMPILFDLDLKYSPSSQRFTLEGSWLDMTNVIMRIIQQNGNEADKEMVKKRITEERGNFWSPVTMTKCP